MPKGIGDVIADDLMEMLSDANLQEPMREIADMLEDQIRDRNQRAVNPDGTARESLSMRYREEKLNKGRRAKPDFKFSGRAMRSLNSDIRNRSIRFGFDDASAQEYMFENQEGIGVPERRIFPEKKDMASRPQQVDREEIEIIIREHLSKSRVLRSR